MLSAVASAYVARGTRRSRCPTHPPGLVHKHRREAVGARCRSPLASSTQPGLHVSKAVGPWHSPWLSLALGRLGHSPALRLLSLQSRFPRPWHRWLRPQRLSWVTSRLWLLPGLVPARMGTLQWSCRGILKAALRQPPSPLPGEQHLPAGTPRHSSFCPGSELKLSARAKPKMFLVSLVL